jgi:hypothetical protein
MTIQITPTYIKIGNYYILETADGMEFSGEFDATTLTPLSVGPVQGSSFGFIAGGSITGPNATAAVNKFPFATSPISMSSHGSLGYSLISGQTHSYKAGNYGFYVGGNYQSTPPTIYVSNSTIQSLALSPSPQGSPSFTVGTLSTPGWKDGSPSQNATHGYVAGGLNPSTTSATFFYPFAAYPATVTSGTATLLFAMAYGDGNSSPTKGYQTNGYTGTTFSEVVQSFPFSTTPVTVTNAGSLSFARNENATASTATDGYSMGGQQGGTAISTINKFPFSTPWSAPATNIGTLGTSFYNGAATASDDYAYFLGGTSPVIYYNQTAYRFPYATTPVNASGIGVITTAITGAKTFQY